MNLDNSLITHMFFLVTVALIRFGATIKTEKTVPSREYVLI